MTAPISPSRRSSSLDLPNDAWILYRDAFRALFGDDCPIELSPAALQEMIERTKLSETTSRATLEIPETWQIVPREATVEMLEAAGHACDGMNLSKLNAIGKSQTKALHRWRAMLKVAPKLVSVKEFTLSERSDVASTERKMSPDLVALQAFVDALPQMSDNELVAFANYIEDRGLETIWKRFMARMIAGPSASSSWERK